MNNLQTEMQLQPNKTVIQGDYTEDDKRWDEFLASEEGQLALEMLADEALAEIRAGKATAILVENAKLLLRALPNHRFP